MSGPFFKVVTRLACANDVKMTALPLCVEGLFLSASVQSRSTAAQPFLSSRHCEKSSDGIPLWASISALPMVSQAWLAPLLRYTISCQGTSMSIW